MIFPLAMTLAASPLTLRSPAFAGGHAIPAKHTCKGADVSPALEWTVGPLGTRSYALIVDDPDAPGGTFVHWVLYNLAASTIRLAEGSREGTAGDNDFGKRGFGGPCPPPGAPHHYRFHLYALDSPVDLAPGATAEQLRAALTGHILAEGVLTGTFQR